MKVDMVAIPQSPYPLNKAMPPETILSFFLDVYQKERDKSVFRSRSASHQRLREGYWGALACAAVSTLEDRKRLILLPSDPRLDVLLLAERNQASIRPAVDVLEFDVKEYTSFSAKDGFADFVTRSVLPKISRFGIIIGLHEDVCDFDASLFLVPENERGILLVCGKSNEHRPCAAVVHYFRHGVEPVAVNVDMTDTVHSVAERVVYENIFRPPMECLQFSTPRRPAT